MAARAVSGTTWQCGGCRSPVSLTAAMCAVCGTILTGQTRVRSDPPAADDDPPTRPAAPTLPAAPACQACHRELPGPDEPVCPYCGAVPSRVRPRAATVELRFDTGTVRVPAGDTAVIGRQGTHDSDRLLHGCEYVSRWHVVVRVAADGSARAREERPSANGTFVNGRRLGPDWCDLPDGAQLRLGSLVAAAVRYEREPKANRDVR